MKKFTLALMMGCLTIPAMAQANNASTANKKADMWFSKIDTNGDGMISKEEHQAFGDKMFAEADTNGDGMISKEEMRAMKMKEMQDMHAQMGKGTKHKAATGNDSPNTENTENTDSMQNAQ